MPRVLAIVPAFNEAASLEAVVADLRSNAPGIEIVVVNDASTDTTGIVAYNANVRVLNLPVNLGYFHSVQAGLVLAQREQFDAAFQFDADGQHVGSEVPHLLEPVLNGSCDVTIGSRFLGVRSYQVPYGRRAGIRLLNAICTALARKRVTDAMSGFRAYNKRAIAQLALEYPIEPEAIVTLTRQGFRVCEVPVEMAERVAGQSYFTPLRSALYFAKVLLVLFARMIEDPEPTSD
jgi:glycosyltransferase involved in cell wall biosynthesis